MTVNTEVLHVIYLLKALLNQLLARPKRSGIVITSSSLAITPIAGFITHSAAKVFSSYLGQALNLELKDKIDVLSYECGMVRTKQLDSDIGGPAVVPAARATWGCLRDLGTFPMTYGAFRHEVFAWIVPTYIMKRAFISVGTKILEKTRKQQAAAKSN